MKHKLIFIIVALMSATLASAQGGNMMGGGGMMDGSGMFVIADDGSILVTEMGMGPGMMGNPGELDRDLINIDPDGNERWRLSFEDGWPMRPVSDGDLVIVALADDWWMGSGGPGDHGWGHGGGKTHDEGESLTTLVAVQISTGAEAWRVEIEGDMVSPPQFTPDGSRFYITVRDMDHEHGGGPWRQDEASGSGMLMSSTLMAIDRSGTTLWSLDLDDHMGGGPMAGGLS